MLKARIPALTPGIPMTSIFSPISLFTSLTPGSEIQGVPASDTKAQLRPSRVSPILLAASLIHCERLTREVVC